MFKKTKEKQEMALKHTKYSAKILKNLAIENINYKIKI